VNTPPCIRVVVADDHEVVRAGLVALLSREADLRVVGAARSSAEALDVVDRCAPDVVVADYLMPEMNGAELCKEILRLRPSVGVIILTSHMADEVVHACLRAGARGYMTKEMPGTDIPDAIRAVARGDAVLASAVTNRVVEWARQARFEQRQREPLTPREVQILTLMGEGLSNREIATRLRMNEHTVRWYARRVKMKLGASGRADAVATGIQRGVI
jgi:two-component system response regulator DevR